MNNEKFEIYGADTKIDEANSIQLLKRKLEILKKAGYKNISYKTVKNIKSIIKNVIANGDDYEYYPTTAKMINVIAKDIKANNSWKIKDNSILDVGCGNGNALELIQENIGNTYDEYGQSNNGNIFFKKYGIEKSRTLIKAMNKEIIIIGNDFLENTLIDKQMDYIFCNPPYSEYQEWASKLILEAKTKHLYLIIPQRWRENNDIKLALKKRIIRDVDENVKVLGSFDFIDSEYRKARAKVDIIKISFQRFVKDPFTLWFEENFNIKTEVEEDPEVKEEEKENELIEGKNLIERIDFLYKKNLNHLLENYKSLETVDPALLKELGVEMGNLKEGLKQKIKSLKNLYWQELFDNLDKITDRLTSKYRELLLSKLTSQTAVDINIENMYSVVIWVIKNANSYQDEQLLYIYKSMTEPKNVSLYKSNSHWVKDTWRMDFKNKMNNYKLEYRLVLPCGCGEADSSYYDFNGMNKHGYDYIKDIFTIAKTLGINLKKSGLDSRQWVIGQQETFFDDEGNIFAELRAYKNGNLHAKFNKDFIKILNIEAGKLNGWIKDPIHAADELNLKVDEVIKHFNCLQKIEFNSDVLQIAA